jgi:DNA-binding NarL/FixJ family response regulator
MSDIKVVIADSNQLIRCGLSGILEAIPEAQLLDQVGDETALFASLKQNHPNVLLIDFLANGFTVDSIPSVKVISPETRVVAITTEQSGHTIVNALKAGVDSYIKKDCDVQEIKDAILETGKGGKFFCGQILEAIRKESIDLDDLALMNISCEPVLLSRRELEVITLIAEGHTNVQIAEKLFLSNHTVNTHRKNIMSKLGVNNTAAIVMYAVKTGLVSPNKFLFSPQQS